ncbi:MAG TPA: hypothetical protein VMX35_04605 [Acidobacteriota bacterium]|nr:hypothetical protein [Acidobacteriota bacterium]
MKILFTNHHLSDYAGTETFTWTVAHALRRAGHEVVLATAQKGPMSGILEDEGFEVCDDFEELKGCAFDIIHAQHNVMAMLARHHFPETPMIFMGHGVFHPLEQPPTLDLGIGGWVTVSEEIEQIWSKQRGLKDVKIFRNPIDCQRFRPLSPPNDRLKHVLVISNNYPINQRNMIKRACDLLGCTCRFVGGMYNAAWNTEELINEADLVVSIGRGVLEAMACGRAALIYDRHGCDGLMTPEVYQESRKCNLSGRRFGRKPNFEGIMELLAGYDSRMGEANRELVVGRHDIEKNLPQLEKIYAEAMSGPVPESAPELPVNEIVGSLNRWQSSNRNLRIRLEEEGTKLRKLVHPIPTGGYQESYWILAGHFKHSEDFEDLLAGTGTTCQPYSEFTAAIKAESAAIIAGGPSARKTLWKNRLADYDIICRINKFSGTELEHSTGTGCDLWVTNGYAMVDSDLREIYGKTEAILFAGDMSPAVREYPLIGFAAKLAEKRFSFFPRAGMEEMISRLDGELPTNGFVAFRALCDSGVREFLLLGFDYFLEPPYDSLKPEDTPAEVRLLAEECIRLNCRVTCPSPLHQLLQAQGVREDLLKKA